MNTEIVFPSKTDDYDASHKGDAESVANVPLKADAALEPKWHVGQISSEQLQPSIYPCHKAVIAAAPSPE